MTSRHLPPHPRRPRRLGAGPIAALAADAPKVIRIGLPLVGTGNRPVGGSWNFATVQIKGSLEQEFKADGIRIEWNNFKGAGPALNEAIANKLIDVFAIGDLPGIVGKASGLKTKLIAADNRRYAYAIAVPADSPARSIEDLKGKKLAVFKGTAMQLGFGKFLSRHGLSEKDFKIINMDSNTATAALATKDVDALFTAPSQLYPLEDRGVAKVIYNERHDPAAANDRGQAYVVATEDFEKAHPELLQRIRMSSSARPPGPPTRRTARAAAAVGQVRHALLRLQARLRRPELQGGAEPAARRGVRRQHPAQRHRVPEAQARPRQRGRRRLGGAQVPRRGPQEQRPHQFLDPAGSPAASRRSKR
jgi:hypothetical protein